MTPNDIPEARLVDLPTSTEAHDRMFAYYWQVQQQQAQVPPEDKAKCQTT